MTEAQQTATTAPNGPISNIPAPLLNLDEMEPMKIPDSVEMLDPYKVLLDDAYNPRRYQVPAAKVLEYVADIVQNGQISPIVARRIGGRIYAIDGRTRVQAILHINEKKLTDKPLKVAASIVDMEDAQSYLTAVSANVRRTDMSAIDHANVIRVLMDEFGLKNRDVCKALKRNPSWVTEHTQLSELRPVIQKKIHDGKIPYTTAKELLGMSEEQQDEYISDIESGASRATIRKRVAKSKGKSRGKGVGKGAEVSATMTLKELRADYEVLAGLDLEEGEECRFDEQIQALGVLLIKHMDGRMGAKSLVNQIEKLYS